MTTESHAAVGGRAIADDRRLLRRLLQLDALVSGANGAAYLAAGGVLADALDLSSTLLRVAGAVLVVFAFVWALSTRPSVSPGAVRAVVAVNVVWALESIAALAFGWVDPNTAGAVWIVLQAIVVAAFAGAQAYAGARRGTRDA